jgi:hypothetical protein
MDSDSVSIGVNNIPQTIYLYNFVLQSDEQPAEVNERQVLVSGLEENMSTDFLRLIFSSKIRSGGGQIDDVQLSEDGKMALLTFRKRKGE